MCVCVCVFSGAKKQYPDFRVIRLKTVKVLSVVPPKSNSVVNLYSLGNIQFHQIMFLLFLFFSSSIFLPKPVFGFLERPFRRVYVCVCVCVCVWHIPQTRKLQCTLLSPPQTQRHHLPPPSQKKKKKKEEEEKTMWRWKQNIMNSILPWLPAVIDRIQITRKPEARPGCEELAVHNEEKAVFTEKGLSPVQKYWMIKRGGGREILQTRLFGAACKAAPLSFPFFIFYFYLFPFFLSFSLGSFSLPSSVLRIMRSVCSALLNWIFLRDELASASKVED